MLRHYDFLLQNIKIIQVFKISHFACLSPTEEFFRGGPYLIDQLFKPQINLYRRLYFELQNDRNDPRRSPRWCRFLVRYLYGCNKRTKICGRRLVISITCLFTSMNEGIPPSSPNYEYKNRNCSHLTIVQTPITKAQRRIDFFSPFDFGISYRNFIQSSSFLSTSEGGYILLCLSGR